MNKMFGGCVPHVSARRKHSLRGEGSQAWLSERNIFGKVDSHFVLVSDEIDFGNFRAARLWHSEGEYSIARSSVVVSVIFQIEGKATLHSSTWGASKTLAPGDVAILPGGDEEFRFAAHQPVARYEFVCDLAGLPSVAREEFHGGRVFHSPAKEYREAVAASANIALNSKMSREELGFVDFGVGVKHLMNAFLLQALEPGSFSLSNDLDPVYREALRLIVTRATDGDFDVESLAESLGMTSRNLRYVFSREGSSAKAALTAERVRRARDYAAKSENGLVFTEAEIARLSGFRDVRSLRRALEKLDEQVDNRPRAGGGLTACCCHLVRCLARGVSLRRRAAFHAAAVPFLPAVATHSCRSSHSPLTGPSSPYRLIWRGPGGVSPRGCGTAPGGFPQAAWRRRRVALPSLRGTAGQPPSACRHSRGTRGRRHSPRASPPTLR